MFTAVLNAARTTHSLLRGLYAFIMILRQELLGEPHAAHVRTRHAAPAQEHMAARGGGRWLLCRAFATYSLIAIWAFEGLNFCAHVALRPVPWNTVSQAIGYLLWALQLWSLAACQLAEPAQPTPEWVARAKNGEVVSSTCHVTGEPLPPRARYVRRAGMIVLGFDHWCFWLGTPVGFSNRKAFLLFLWYSTLFTMYGAAHTLFELLGWHPARLGLGGPLPPPGHGLLASLPRLWEAACAQGHGPYTAALVAAAALNPLAALALAGLTAQPCRR